MSPTEASTPRPSRVAHVLVAAAYLALSLFVHRSILAAPGDLVPLPAAMVGTTTGMLYQADQRFVVAGIASNIEKALRGPGALAGFGFCYPLRESYTLGEHMFGESLLALPAYLPTRDPVLGYNAAVVLSVWITALGMYALALYWTRSIPAAFVSGMLFAFSAARLGNPAHPFVHGNLWTPPALLFAHQLFARQRWRDAGALALAIVLQLLESFYQVLALAILGGTYGLTLLVRHRGALRALLPKLVAVGLVSAGAAMLVLGPYLQARDRWGLLQGRTFTLLVPLADYLPGRPSSIGLVALVLALLGLADRLRGPRCRAGEDPRIPFAVAGLVVAATTMRPFRLPLLRWVVPNPLSLLESVVPGLDAVRVLASLRFGVYLVAAFLAAYGASVILGWLRGRWRLAAAAGLSLCVLLEAYDPTATLTIRSARLAAYRIAPSPQVRALLRDLPEGAVLNLPFGDPQRHKLRDVPESLVLAAYHRRPVAACYNSFTSPLEAEVTRLADRLPDVAAADALYAMGFRTILVHHRHLGAPRLLELAPLLDDPMRITRVGEADRLVRFTLSSPVPVATTLDTIALRDDRDRTDLPSAVVAPPATAVELDFENGSSAAFRHPTMEPIPLTARWYDDDGALVATSPARGMLPVALARGERVTRTLRITAPELAAGGSYRIEITPEGSPDVVLSRRTVRMAPG
ncbi:MAG: hypothetical protein FJ148_01780 [Deltaproteobacteria bacterium]|nr:hypothetical protein [Deltaproteobacteria bacterium]